MTEYLHSFDTVSDFNTKYENETSNKTLLKISTPEGAEYTATTNNLIYECQIYIHVFSYLLWKDEITGELYRTSNRSPSVGDTVVQLNSNNVFIVSEINTEPLEENDYYHEPWVSLTDMKKVNLFVDGEEYEYVSDCRFTLLS